MRRHHALLVSMLSLAMLPFACAKTPASPVNGTGASTTGTSGSGGAGGSGGSTSLPFTGPPAWNRAVTPPSDTEAATQRAACAYKQGSLPAETQGASAPMGSAIPVNHILIVMMENRSFDSYFSKLPEYGQPDVNVPPAGYTNPDGMGGTVAPYHDNVFCLADTDHSWAGSHKQVDDGLMDGFFLANNGSQSPNAPGCAATISCSLPPFPPAGSTPNSGMRSLAYYDQTDIPFYYWLASQFSIADNYHAALLGPTWPNRDYLYGATSRGVTDSSFANFNDQKGACTTDAQCPGGAPGSCFMGAACKGTCKVDSDCGIDAPQGICDVANGGVCNPIERTIFDYMEERGINWKVYASTFEMGTPGWAVVPSAFVKYEATHQFTLADYMADAAAGSLPDVAFVDPDLGDENYQGQDEHPPGMPQGGQHFTATVIDALTKSPAWSSSALFLTYDEHGGHWDHAVPPPACPPDDIAPVLSPGDPPGLFNQYGIRVPMTLVSPFAKKHHVSHDVYDHTSIVRFIEARFTIGALSNRDANALAPWDMFDFTGVPNKTPPTVTVPPIDQAGQDACAAMWVGDAGSGG